MDQMTSFRLIGGCDLVRRIVYCGGEGLKVGEGINILLSGGGELEMLWSERVFRVWNGRG